MSLNAVVEEGLLKRPSRLSIGGEAIATTLTIEPVLLVTKIIMVHDENYVGS